MPNRRPRVAGLLVLVAVLVAGLAYFLPYLRPPARCHFVPLFVSSYAIRNCPPWPGGSTTATPSSRGHFFGGSNEQDAVRLDQAVIVRQLEAPAHRPADEAVVVYLSAQARTTVGGTVQILPADADPGDPATWLPLSRVLEVLSRASARRRLLILDLAGPPPGGAAK